MGDQDDYCWENLPIELLELVVQRLELLKDVINFAVVCKSWKSAASVLEKENTWLPSKHHPWLLLAEDTGFDLSTLKASTDGAVLRGMPYVSNRIRGLFSLAKQKVYNLDLPEATYKVIVGTSNGWLITYGRDFIVNLLHPLSRQQIQLPRIPAAYPEYDYHDDYDLTHLIFVKKVVMCSEVTTKSALQLQDTKPMMMAIFDYDSGLCFARLGDESWRSLESMYYAGRYFHDIVYYREKFYAINVKGTVYMCDIDNHYKIDRHNVSKLSTSFPIKKEGYNDDDYTYYYLGDDTYYLVESLSGSHIWVVLRLREAAQYFKKAPIPGEFWYTTIDFKIFKLEVHYPVKKKKKKKLEVHDDVILSYPSYTWSEEVKNLGNEALFIGRSSSISVASSEFIQPNSIYFTDDSLRIRDVGGGHDMGIFNVETGKIQPHFQGSSSVHHFSPPLWYISK